MKIFKELMQIFFISCLLIANFYVPRVEAKTLGDLKTELAEFQKQYEKNQQSKQLTQDQINQTKNNINSIEKQVTQIGDDINSLNNKINELNEKIAKDEEEIESILSFTQVENGESAYLEYIIGAKDFTDFIYRAAVSGQLTSYNNDLVNEYKNGIEENKEKTKELANKKVELKGKQESLQVEINKLESSLESLNDEELSIDDLIAAKKSEIKVYENKGCKDNEDISTCGKSILPADTAFWRPLIKGYIAGELGLFGYRYHPVTGSYAMHYGLDVSTSGANAGTTKVYSVANGLVVYVISTYGSCAGKRVYIQHNVNGVTYTSGYLHLNNIYVKEGDTVTKDTVIGTISGWPDPVYGKSDTCSNGAHLHLEISTGTFTNDNYSSHRSDPTNYINFPSVNSYWYDRTTRY